ncbi:hypothetical protein MOOR_28350 [Moorella thermoacetica]|uniref:Uncharacterized protein n=1 Tax=Neomoorella thermoacetica TaxID=1525 RepID=A0A1J5JDG8_NEOTH|nr:hypothetical protein MOOR_28350 [Moorella thermoacetica]
MKDFAGYNLLSLFAQAVSQYFEETLNTGIVVPGSRVNLYVLHGLIVHLQKPEALPRSNPQTEIVEKLQRFRGAL